MCASSVRPGSDGALGPAALARLERGRRRDSEASLMAAAERELVRWYRDVGTRVALSTGGYAGTHRGQVITTGLKCFCGKPTKALGLCSPHYVSIWKRVHGRIAGRRFRGHRWALCRHPGENRPHHSYGLCGACAGKLKYSRRFYREHDAAMADATPVGRHRNAWRTAPRCGHPERKHEARGLCERCYDAWRRRRPTFTQGGRDRASGPVVREYRPRKQSGIMRCGHNGRRHGAHGLCKSCSERERRKSPNAPRARCHPDRPHHAKGQCQPCYGRRRGRNRPSRRCTPARCHPAKMAVGHGLCGACYRMWRIAHRPPVHLFVVEMAKRTLAVVRPKGSGRTPARCHPERRPHGRGLCDACYFWWVKQDRPPLEAFIRRRARVTIGAPIATRKAS